MPAWKSLRARWEGPRSQHGKTGLSSAIVKLLIDHRVDLAYFCGRVYNLSPTFDRPTIIMYVKDGQEPVMVSNTLCPAVYILGT